MARIIIAVLFLCFPLLTQAQEKLPDAPQPKPQSRKVFYIGTAALAASKSFDAWSTQDLLNRGGWEAANGELGRNPSSGRLAGVAAGDFALQTTLFYFTERNHHAWVRWSGRALVGFLVEQHLRLGSCNFKINTRSSTVQTCH